MTSGKTIGENEITRQTWINASDLAKKADVKYTTLMKVESGMVNKLNIQSMTKIAKILGDSIEDLIS